MAIGTPVDLGTNSAKVAGTTIGLTLGVGVAAGSKLVVFAGCDTSAKTASVADSRSGSNVYAVDVTANATQPCGAYIATCEVVVALLAGDVITVTFSGSTTDRSIGAVSVTGLVSITPLDKSTSANGTATGWSSGATATTTQADEIIFGLAVENDAALLTGVTSSPGGGFTEIHDFGNTDGVFLTSTYLIVSATGAQTASGTWAGAGLSPRWQAVVATYKAAPSSGVPAPRPHLIYMRKNR
jgi:hypothetical protein